MVGARSDGRDNLLGFRGSKNELDVFGRLFHQLQQRIKPSRGDHVRLVEDEDLEPVANGSESGTLPQLTRIINTVVRGSIDLYNIKRARTTRSQFAARITLATRGVRRILRAVQASCQNAGGGSLTAAARAREKVCVGDLLRPKGSHKRLSHVFLPDHLVKSVGTVTAI